MHVLISSLSVSNRENTSLIKGIYLFHTNGFVSLSFTEASLCCGEAGEKEKERARGTMGRGKRREASSYRPPRAFYFFDYCHIFIRIPSGSVCGGERFCIVLINNCCLSLSHENIGKRDCCLSPIAVPWVWRKSFPLNWKEFSCT